MNIQLLRPLGGLGGGGVRIPFQFDAILNIDGTIIQVESNYYFADKSINHRHFLITGYDFPENWSGGFPYKSAATVSAPVGNASFIAADVNNFFYDSGGTPNQIPVISFFQDIDYAHKLFCRHQDQLLDVNGVETFEPRVKEIVLYSNAKTGADLIKCNSYYSVPVEDATAKWVDFVNGNNSNLGSKTQPYLTLQYVESLTLPANTKIYIKTGTHTLTAALNPAKQVKYIGVGLSKIIEAAPYGITIASNLTSIQGLFINNTRATGTSITGNGAINLEKCYFTSSSSTYDVLMQQPNNIIKYCVFSNRHLVVNTSALLCNTNIDGCYINSTGKITLLTGAGGVFTLKHCNILQNGIDNRISATVNLFNNTVMGQLVDANNQSTTGTYNIEYNRCKSKAGINWIISNSGTDAIVSNYSWNIKNNEFDIITGSLNGSVIRIVNQDNVDISGNIIRNITETNQFGGVFVYSNTITCTNTKIYNNVIISINNSGSILIGLENGTTDNKHQGTLIFNNHIIGNYAFGGLTSQHAVAVFRNPTANKIYRNKIDGAALGVVIKSPGLTSSTEVYYNVVERCAGGLLAKGEQGVKFYNNTVYKTSISTGDSYCIGMIDHEAGGYAINTIIKNNILIDHSPVLTSGNVFLFDGTGQSTVGLNSDNNVIYSLNNKICNIAAIDTWEEWQDAGDDINSQNLNPNLATGLWPDSPISIGENLGTTYEDGLDISTNWGSATTVPSVVTKKQTGTNWQVGAFVQ